MTKLPHDACVGVENKVMAVKLSEEPLHSDRPQPTQKRRELKGRDAADSKHVYRLRIVTEHQRTALGRTPPQTLFSERNLPIPKVHTDVGIKQSKPINGRKRRSGPNAGQVIDRSNNLPRAIRWSRHLP